MISSQTEAVRTGPAAARPTSGVVGLLAAFGVSVGVWLALIVAAVLILA